MQTLIAIPCYNHNNSLNTLLDKIREYTNNDIIIIDDGCLHPINISNKIYNCKLIRNDIMIDINECYCDKHIR